ncbi:MAG: hypothetical protein CVV47_02870 [Spirochaetae bacterium HGW-Spirochaetae-3]|jgi:hypothetical protein|nr:MAG: hypothetical protein CVV47_02870 [Spirochaetae bacterium HGW-Spirochaetae-3]
MLVTRRNPIALLALAIVVAASAATPASAQSRSIYGGGVDEEAVLVRLVDAGAAEAVTLRLGAVSLSTSAPGDATPYRQIAADIYMLTYLGERYEFLPEPGSFYTIAALDDRLEILSDVKHVDPARAQLYFYNLSPAAAELKTGDGSVSVAGPCPSDSSAQAPVNPVRITLAVFAGGTRLGEPVSLRLERGASYSIFAYGKPGNIDSFSIKAATE